MRLDSDAGRRGRNTGRGCFGFAWLSWFLDQTTSVTINQFETEATKLKPYIETPATHRLCTGHRRQGQGAMAGEARTPSPRLHFNLNFKEASPIPTRAPS